jgi:Uncharacterised nucleotidyltransferase
MADQWPTPHQARLLHAALGSRDEAERAWSEWKRRGSLDRLTEGSFRLLPLLYRNLLAHGIADPDLARLKGIYRQSWYLNQRLFHCGGQALRLLAEAGLETMVLKGAALSVAHYADTGARAMTDFDVLVRTRDGGRALEVLEGAGWERVVRIAPARLLRGRHSSPLAMPGGEEEVDLHWRALAPAARDDDFWAAAVPLEVAGVKTRTLAPADQLLHVLVHGLASDPAPVRWVADAVTVARTGGPLDWDRLVERAVARRVMLPVAVGVRYLREAFELPVPASALARLDATTTTAAERLAHRVAFRPHTPAGTAMWIWDDYRRLRAGEHDSPAPQGYIQHIADKSGLPSRRHVIPFVGRRVVRPLRRGGARTAPS